MSPIPAILVATALVAAGGTAASSPPVGPPAHTRASCDRLPAVHQVSFRSAEARLFRRVVAVVGSSGGIVPDGGEVARRFDACLDVLEERFEEADPSAPMRTALARMKRSFSADGTALMIRITGRTSRTHVLADDPARLAQRVVSRTVRDLRLDTAPRAELANLLWFVWFEAYVRATGQKYNGYDFADELALEEARDRGRSFAVGFEPEMNEGHLTVGEIRDDRLREAGLEEGSEVTALDGRAFSEMSLTQYQEYWLRATPFSYELQATGPQGDYRVRGESIPMRHRTIVWGFDGGVAYIRILRFTAESLVEMRRALRDVQVKQAGRLVLDLRRNPGGRVQPGLVDVFFKPGQTVMSYQDDDGAEPVDVDATVEYNDLPTAVLIDRDTASMAETMAAAFKTHARGLLFGETTTGKGVGQTVYRILDEGRLHLVERTYFYPGRRESWNDAGIVPDVDVPIDDQTRSRLLPYLDSTLLHISEQKPLDPVLRKAIEWLEEAP